MKIGRWEGAEGGAEGFIHDGRAIEFLDGWSVADALGSGLPDLRSRFGAATAADAGVQLAEVRLLAPLRPATVRDFVTFEEHVEGITAGVQGASDVPAEWYQAPTFYFTNPHTILGDGEMLSPPVSERLDFELEVAVVVGGQVGGASNLTPEAAAGRIFGCTILNDWSARDLQAREMKVHLGPAKGKDFGTSLGPWIVTADEVEGYLDAEGFLELRAETFVNGELIGTDLLSNMGWTFRELVAYASRNSVVVPGDVLGSGTVGNGGCLGELWGRNGGPTPPPLREGDEVCLVVEGLGKIVNRVGPAVAAPPVAAARPGDRRRARGGLQR
ncbi:MULTISPECIES: fumarylacetoacetate hydrolase family protein [unclassified Microbacterium]|uniref:fumarylacetoacetate hydrolase family protein n=1 Tax=unclassified Microbacterium TaxID=2609290 RepID=UPI00214C9A47|nr:MULTISPECIES: fumarylacetoacetate hydrolase family protein [unclassified Microbacterium]MCR2811157.1 fumarylacetoacetate hydrolase family protein [Microbacterium sp. zg.B185]WIM20730.1 fumarylacetoacetate hydrolase family protein [Microbacterium sp. zg-B185]